MIFNVSLWLKQVDLVKQLVSYYPNDLAWATTADEIEKGFASGDDHDKEEKKDENWLRRNFWWNENQVGSAHQVGSRVL